MRKAIYSVVLAAAGLAGCHNYRPEIDRLQDEVIDLRLRLVQVQNAQQYSAPEDGIAGLASAVNTLKDDQSKLDQQLLMGELISGKAILQLGVQLNNLSYSSSDAIAELTSRVNALEQRR